MSAETEIDQELIEPAATSVDERKLGVPPHATPARDRPLAGRDRELVRTEPRGAGTRAPSSTRRFESVTRLQVVTANIEACRPPSATFAGAALVALADARLRGHTDAIERGMTYTADNQLRLLHDQRRAAEDG